MKKIVLLSLSALMFCCLLNPVSAAPIKLDVFFESMDGRGWQWLFLSDALRRSRTDDIELRVFCIVSEDSDGKWTSARGDVEVEESKRIAVIGEYHNSALFYYLNARSLSPWASGWRDAAIFSGIDPDGLAKEVKKIGDGALRKHYLKAKKKSVSKASVFINDKLYGGSQKLLSVMKVLNASLPENRRFDIPKEKAILKFPAPKFWVITSKNSSGKNDKIIEAFSKYFSNLKTVDLRYSSKERKKRFPDIDFIPAYVVEDNKNSRAKFADMIKTGVFTKKKGYLVYYDKSRRGVFVKRKLKPKTLELFTMSQCPFGVLAENSVMEAFDKKLISPAIKVKLRYIVDGAKGADGKISFKSLHGVPEWEENVRQVYVADKFPDRLFAYLKERNKNMKSTQWEAAAAAAGIKTEDIIQGFESAKSLLLKDADYTRKLGISSSPTFLVDGKYFAIGINELRNIKGFEKLPLKSSGGKACN